MIEIWSILLSCQETDTFDDCAAIVREDSLNTPLRWRDKTAAVLVGRPLRLQLKSRDARLYALRGRFHFLDAQDRQLIRDGQTIEADPFCPE